MVNQKRKGGKGVRNSNVNHHGSATQATNITDRLLEIKAENKAFNSLAADAQEEKCSRLASIIRNYQTKIDSLTFITSLRATLSSEIHKRTQNCPGVAGLDVEEKEETEEKKVKQKEQEKTTADDSKEGNNCNKASFKTELVCYGIGKFSHQKYSTLLQRACACYYIFSHQNCTRSILLLAIFYSTSTIYYLLLCCAARSRSRSRSGSGSRRVGVGTGLVLFCNVLL